MNAPALLTNPSKMPGRSFSLPAGRACPASKLATQLAGERSTCAGCYAKQGRYRFPNVANAQQYRFDLVLQSLRTDGGQAFVERMVVEIRRNVRANDPYFRIHDSGDLFSEAYVNAWIQICTALPKVYFWCPTREWIRPEMMPVLQRFAALPNVSLRPSALGINDPAPVIEGLAAGTSVAAEADHPLACPATATAQKHCDDHGCRKCWQKTEEVFYVIHGAQRTKLRQAAQGQR